LKGHTTFLVTADQMGLLSEYMTLARLLQPSVVVLEDVDLIARDRTRMDNPCQESLLNRLLNEMDGLKEEADILFILTTNRPADLEQALSTRPGRIDQAIEFPLPDKECRAKLVRLYSRGVSVSEEVLQSIVVRTEKTSAAFIKELMRRSILNHLERADEPLIEHEDVDGALQELLGSGSLNLLLLGQPREDPLT
jgi:ATP-dependent 26S proteasome regulatory subunit